MRVSLLLLLGTVALACGCSKTVTGDAAPATQPAKPAKEIAYTGIVDWSQERIPPLPTPPQEPPEAETLMREAVRLAQEANPDRDLPRSVALYQEAIKKGSLNGKFFLGIAYMIGRGVDQDLEAAAKLMREAADAGHGLASYFYADLLFRKAETPEQKFAAYYWLHRARWLGDAEARETMKEQLAQLIEEGVTAENSGLGDSLEDAVVFQGVTMGIEGIRREMEFIAQFYPSWKKVGQSLLEHEGRAYDRIRIESPAGQVTHIYFDVHDWYGRMPEL